MKLYCRQGEKFTPSNWGLMEWLMAASILISLITIAFNVALLVGL